MPQSYNEMDGNSIGVSRINTIMRFTSFPKVQGMIALKHIRDQFYTHVDIVEAAPENIGKTGKYKGVGAHLFAIACKLSWDVGNEGYVQFTAKTNLVEHYRNTLGARNIDTQRMFIDSYGALKLIKTYFPEEA
ncbi:hypothetical protein [uncultured Fibrobacter sp.]|uniref:hypothetical protein n=1 Tax=uncultured Fibrobacter sp. TaxID=261512 RepID=UPI0025E3EA3E|nr:hypothetical protein [uncultured Fibrobacter sp.]